MRSIFLSSGHGWNENLAIKLDRGASSVFNDVRYYEAKIALEFRDLLNIELQSLGHCPILDNPINTTAHTINYFKALTSNDSIVVDIHCNSASALATGAEVLIPANPTDFERDLALKLSEDISSALEIKNRGVKTELQSHHGRLGWMKLTGENILLELFFLSNEKDLSNYNIYKLHCAKKVAETLANYA